MRVCHLFVSMLTARTIVKQLKDKNIQNKIISTNKHGKVLIPFVHLFIKMFIKCVFLHIYENVHTFIVHTNVCL